MSVKINYSKKINTKSSQNLVLFTNEKFGISGFKKYLRDNEILYINDILKTSDLKKKLLVFDISSRKKK